MLNKYNLTLLFIFASFFSTAENKKYSPAEMLEDLDYYYSRITNYHPNLYAYYPKTTFDSLYHDIRKKCSQAPMDSVDFNFLMAQFNGLNDIHTDITNPWWRMQDYYNNNRWYFPTILFQGKNMFLNGNKILKIGNVDASEPLKEIDKTMSWELNPLMKNIRRNELFSLVLKYKYNIVSPYPCVLLTEKGDTISKTVQGVEYYEMKNNPSNPSNPMYWGQKVHKGILQHRFFDANSIAVLYYNSSIISGEQTKEFEAKLQLFFDSVKTKKITHLFIDASMNGGGNDSYHDMIFKYLKFKDLKYSVNSVATYEGMNAFVRYFNSQKTYEKFKKNYAKYKDGNKMIRKVYSYKKQGSKNGFVGDVYIIMGKQTGSSGFDFCEWSKMANIGLLVGETAGQRSPYSGNVIDDELPNSKIWFRCATIYTDYREKELNVMGEDCFLHPDIPYPLIAPLQLSDFKKIIELGKEK